MAVNYEHYITSFVYYNIIKKKVNRGGVSKIVKRGIF